MGHACLRSSCIEPHDGRMFDNQSESARKPAQHQLQAVLRSTYGGQVSIPTHRLISLYLRFLHPYELHPYRSCFRWYTCPVGCVLDSRVECPDTKRAGRASLIARCKARLGREALQRAAVPAELQRFPPARACLDYYHDWLKTGMK